MPSPPLPHREPQDARRVLPFMGWMVIGFFGYVAAGRGGTNLFGPVS